MNWHSLFLNLQEYAYIFIGLFFLLLVLSLFWQVALKLFKKKEKPFPFTLFLIRIFPYSNAENWVSLMEEFYRQLFSTN